MINSNREGDSLIIVAKPNHSSSWRNNKLVLLALSVPSLGAGIAFATLGAWPILPFAGAEIAALTAALYYVNWKLEYRHVITLSENTVSIDKGHYAPRRHWRFDRADAQLAITNESHPRANPRVVVHGHRLDHRNAGRDDVSVGEFLSRDECLALVRLLRDELTVRSHSVAAHLDA